MNVVREKLSGKKTYLASVIYALLPILLQWLGIESGGFVEEGGGVTAEVIENANLSAMVSALRAGIAKL